MKVTPLMKTTNNVSELLKDAQLQFGRLTGPSLEVYAKTFSVLASQAIEEAEALTSCRDHWKTSFEHERENVIRLRRIVYDLHNSDDPAVKPCKCYDCNMVVSKGRNFAPRLIKESK